MPEHPLTPNAGPPGPASLHPAIDQHACTGCGACVQACPESGQQPVLGISRGKAQLLEAARCVGHGACKRACPAGAITLVFANARRGADIPLVSPAFESSIAGLYVAGELGGMGLIRNAMEQGRQAVDAIVRSGRRHDVPLDLLIAGAGPAGFAASLAATQHGLRFVTVEQDSLGGSLLHYPRGKLVMRAPPSVPGGETVRIKELSKEKLLEDWQSVERQAGLKIRYHERVEEIDRRADSFLVGTQKQQYHAARVLLAIGQRGSPRKLGVPGEELSKVVYRLIEPDQYRDRQVLVVGGGDSALEAAVSLSEQPATGVTLSFRGETFERARPLNRLRVEDAARHGRLSVLLSSVVKQIEPDRIAIDIKGRTVVVENDAVIVCVGGMVPRDFLRKIGMSLDAGVPRTDLHHRLRPG